MIIKSFVRQSFSLEKVDVEIVLTPGLPTISVLGLPDRVIQESTKRIQAALLSQGFHMPKGQQVIVNLWPRENKKSSLGLDLAIALGILHETGQKNLPEDDFFIYGELEMDGRVRAPQDLLFIHDEKFKILTGRSCEKFVFSSYSLENLRSEPILVRGEEKYKKWIRPPFLLESYASEKSFLMKCVAHGEHSLILCGSPGSGKTSFADGVASFLSPPNDAQAREIIKNDIYFSQTSDWRPVIRPHHSTTSLAFIGGGNLLKPGEIIRAHHGILILDELLEFSKEVQSALREPMDTGSLYLARTGQRQKFLCQTLVLATSNLCPCGEFIPDQFSRCRCSSLQLRRYLQKLSGPFVDRFSILQSTSHWGDHQNNEGERAPKILEDLQKTFEFQKEMRAQTVPNQLLNCEEIKEKFIDKKTLSLLPHFKSKRREQSCLRLSRTIADLHFSEKIERSHVEQALQFSYYPFENLKKIF